MKKLCVFGFLLLPISLHAQTTVKGLVTEQNSGNKPIPGVQIKALGSAPEASDNAGQFQLQFASKKPGERIVVSEVAKKGYEIVNKDILANWIIQSDPRARTKIVMCPEGTIARNILKYYDISLAALTKGYNGQLSMLQEKLDRTEIDRRAYERQAGALADRFTNQQKQLEELAEKFARENFDDCSDVHRRAFEAFSNGSVDEAIRILESVNSEAEIEKAKAQREKGSRMVTEGNAMQAESDNVIRQNILKLLFQAALYETSDRFEEAGRTYESAAMADSAFFQGVWSASKYFFAQNNADKALRWGRAALAAARAPFDSARALKEVARVLDRHQKEYAVVEPMYVRALAIMRQLALEDPANKPIHVADLLSYLAVLHTTTRRFTEADTEIREALAIQRVLMAKDRKLYANFVVASLLILANLQCNLARCAEGEAMYLEAIEITRSLPDTVTQNRRYQLWSAHNGIANTQKNMRSYTRSERNFGEALRYARLLASANPEAYADLPANTLNNMADVQCLRLHFAEAVATQRESDAIYDSLVKQNPRRYQTARLLYILNLPDIYNQWGKPDTAVLLYAGILGSIRRLYDGEPDRYDAIYLSTLFWYGIALWHAGRYDSADVLLADALGRQRARMAKDSIRSWAGLAKMLTDLSMNTYRQGLPRAIACMEEALALYHRNENGPTPLQTYVARCSSRLAKFQILSRRFSVAETYALQAYDHNQAPKARQYLAPALLYQGRYDEARSMYLSLLKQEYDELQTYREALLADLDEFEEAGVTHPDVAKIRELLKAK
jgi:hypothetical protein